eukprot:13531023-Alexandrium_andersonii.AAC.1
MCGTTCGSALPPLAAFCSGFLRAPTRLSPGGSRSPGHPKSASGARRRHFLGGSEAGGSSPQ